MRRGFRVRLYSDAAQEQNLSRTLGCVRVIWNQVLNWRKELRKETGTYGSYRDTSGFLTELKRLPEFRFLREVSSVPLQQALRHQHRAFEHFWARRSGFPRFKARSGRACATYAKTAFRIEGGRLHLAKVVDPIRWVWSFDLPVEDLEVTSVTIVREPDGSWWASLCVELTDEQEPERPAPTGRVVGIDLGVKVFATLSDEGAEPMIAPDLRRKEANRRRYQRRLARKDPGSKNRDKERRKVARAFRKERQAREDMLQKATTRLVREYDVICVEDLHIAGLLKNRRMAALIQRLGWFRFKALLRAKCARAGKRLVEIDRWTPTSKTCSECGHVLAELRLAVRDWTCPACGTRHDRDVNAAKNILAAGLAVSAGGPGFGTPQASARKPVVDGACGARVRPSGHSPPRRRAAKQEAHFSDDVHPRPRALEAKSPLL